MQAEATLREGTVEIPPAIRDVLRLHDGDTLVFDADSNGVHMHVRQRAGRASFSVVESRP